MQSDNPKCYTWEWELRIPNLDIQVSNKFLKLYSDKSEIQIYYGAAGSAKSYEIAQYILTDLLATGRRWVVLRKVAKTLRFSCFSLFRTIISRLDCADLFTVMTGAMEIRCKSGGNILFLGMDDSDKIKSIDSIDCVWMEEADQFTLAVS